MNPEMWAKLSIQGRRPKAKRKSTTANSLKKALHGRAKICQLWKSSTKRQARIPNWDPAGPTYRRRMTQVTEREIKPTLLLIAPAGSQLHRGAISHWNAPCQWHWGATSFWVNSYRGSHFLHLWGGAKYLHQAFCQFESALTLVW